MLKFLISGNFLIMSYYIEEYADWIKDKFERNSNFTIKGTFNLSKIHLYADIPSENDYDIIYHFKLGEIYDGYIKLDKNIFNIKNNFYIHRDIGLEMNHFVASNKISILKKIDNLINEEVYIGLDDKANLKWDIYTNLIKKFPNKYEVNLYSNARVSSIILNYIDSTIDSETSYNKYLNKKVDPKSSNIGELFKPYEIKKNQTILKHLETMLKKEVDYTEKQWQNEIIKILLLLFPKYISIFSEVKFKDIYSNKDRYLDYLLVDSMGFIDIVEIKKPFRKSIVSENTYRDNHIPNRELSGTIMQIEKYIYYLSKWGMEGEKRLTSKYKSELPNEIELKITNPKGIIIMGRDTDMNLIQLHDFEIIKRKYKNVIEIFTYDDLIRRLKVTINKMKDI